MHVEAALEANAQFPAAGKSNMYSLDHSAMLPVPFLIFHSRRAIRAVVLRCLRECRQEAKPRPLSACSLLGRLRSWPLM